MKFTKFFIIIFAIFIIPLNVFADSALSTVVMEVNSGRILYSRDADSKRLIASITKIMTCIVTLENSSLEKVVTVGDEVLEMYGTNIYIEVSEKISIKDLLYGLMLRSGNDAAVVLAKNVFGSEEKFVMEMNKKAKELGMKNTKFSNPHGLDEDTKNYSTARDMAILSKYAYQNKIYREIVGTKKYSCKTNFKSYLWYNRMSLINNYKSCIGGKNGYTPSAGKTLVSLASEDDMVLSIVTLKDADLYNNHENMYKKYFNEYKLYTIIDKNNFIMDSNFIDSEVYIKKSFKYPLSEDELSSVSTVVKINNNYNEDEKIVGKIIIKFKEEEIGNIDIYRKINKKKDKNILQKFKNLFIR
ncbi:MAG: D-alanyl-D-alanine carboxypeptidase [Bacilli bacterium]|nr:D-alanyl-D-alanine carboxypeptidase [Bacilli bacterium]